MINCSLAAAEAVLTVFCCGGLQHDSVTLRSDDESGLENEHNCVQVMRSFLAGRINDPVSHGEIF